MKVRFRGTGLTRRQRLVFGEDGWVSGEIVPSEGWIGLKLHPLRLKGEKVRRMVVRSEWNLAAGFFFLLLTLLWLGFPWLLLKGGLADTPGVGAALLAILFWLMLFLGAVELGAGTLRTVLEIETEGYWSDLFEVPVAPWSKRKVQRWADKVVEKLGSPIENTSSLDDH